MVIKYGTVAYFSINNKADNIPEIEKRFSIARKIVIALFLLTGLLFTIHDSRAETVTFIYSTDFTSASDFKSLLDPTSLSTDLIPAPNGMIKVQTTNKNATFTLYGPATYSGSGTSWNRSNISPGTYTITYWPVSGYRTPSSETKNISDEGMIYFFGDYLPKKRSGDKIDYGDGYVLLIKRVNPEDGKISIELQLDNNTIGTKDLKKNESYKIKKYNQEPFYFEVIDIYHDATEDYFTYMEMTERMLYPHLDLDLNVASVPPGADILIDNTYVGKTPKRITIIDLEKHSLRLLLSGYTDDETTFKFDDINKSKDILRILNKNQSLKGDVDDDDSVTGIDAMWIAQYVIGKRTGINTNVADVDDDGNVTGIDAMWIAQYVIGKRTW